MKNYFKLEIISVWLLIVLLLSGCAAGVMSRYTYDQNTGRNIKTLYSPLFSTDSQSLAEGAEFKVSAVITRRIEPISHGLLTSMGGLSFADIESKATAVVHFKNDSTQIYRINLKKIIVLNQEFSVAGSEIILKPGDRFDSKEFAIRAPTYDTTFTLKLTYDLDGAPLSQDFSMRRKTADELDKKKR